VFSVIAVYFATQYFEKNDKYKKFVLIIVLIVTIGILIVLKYTNTLVGILLIMDDIQYSRVNWIAPLAISFYTLQLVAYLLDCYWGVIKAEKNILKLLLYTIYFPQMVSGPISRFNELGASVLQEKKFDYDKAAIGFKRIAWGIIKKLFVAARLKLLADTIFNNPSSFAGIWIWVGAALFIIELYADFSGCMDIVIGVSLCLGIQLTENFNAPMLSRSVQEFWQRWHITLGTWLRDYILNPLLKSEWLITIGKRVKKVFGKKFGKKIPAYIAMFFVWTAMGIWHGDGLKYIIGEGYWFWLIIVLEQTISPLTKKIKNNKIYDIFSILRTFFLVCVGNIFFRAASFRSAVDMIKLGFIKPQNWNLIEIFRLYGIGKDAMGGLANVGLFLFFLFLMFLFEIMIYKGGNPYKYISKQKIIIRWGIYWLFVIVIAYNIFGAQADFIYAKF
jgi:membrane bound O-acyl transferase MBOAT family protein